VATGAEGAALAHQHPHALFLSADGELHGASYRRTGMLTGEDSVGLMARRNARNAARIALQAAEAEYGQAHKLESGIHATLLETEAKISKLEKAYRVHLSEVERAEARSQEQLTRSQRAAEEISSLQEESRQLNEVLGIASAEETQATVDRDAAENSRLEKNEVLTSRQADAEQAQVVY
jgi:chromosome segregation ATPase